MEPGALEVLDTWVDLLSERRGRTVSRAKVLESLLRRVKVPTGPDAEKVRRAHAAYMASHHDEDPIIPTRCTHRNTKPGTASGLTECANCGELQGVDGLWRPKG